MTRAAKIAGGIAATILVSLFVGLVANSGSPLTAYRRPLRRVPRSGNPAPLDQRLQSLPKIVFWAWERPEDFRFLGARPAGVAFLAKTIYLRSATESSQEGLPKQVLVRPRLQPLRVTPDTPLIAVVRIESRRRVTAQAVELRPGPSPASAGDSASYSEQVASEIVHVQDLPGVRAVQIDFDAPVSEHGFYAALLADVRGKLRPSLPLSITALASWCIGDRWLEQLPPGTIQEAVPMLFRMGSDHTVIARFLRSGDEFPVSACRASLGLSTDEPLSQKLLSGQTAGLPAPNAGKRVYVFAPRSWTPSQAQKILAEFQP